MRYIQTRKREIIKLPFSLSIRNGAYIYHVQIDEWEMKAEERMIVYRMDGWMDEDIQSIFFSV